MFVLIFFGLLVNGVFGAEDAVKRVSVMEGDSVTLNTNTEIQKADLILWTFGPDNTLIGQINKMIDKVSLYDEVLDGRFRDRLHLDDQTGDLTITNITTEHSGLYELQIVGRNMDTAKQFSIIVSAPMFTSETPFLNATQEHACIIQTRRNSDDFKYMAYTITYSVVFTIGFIGNCMALIVFLRFTPKKSASTVLMTNLAISDASFSLTLPFRLVYYSIGGYWAFPDWLCRWCVFSFYVNLYTSVLFLTGLSVLRYFAVLHPIRHKTLATVRRASLSCFAIWIFVAALSTPFLMSGTLKREDKIICFEPGNITSWKRIFILNYVRVSFGFVIPFIIILVCYGCIFSKLGWKIGDQKQITHRRSVYMIVVVLSTFLLCFLPYHVIHTVHLHAIVSTLDCQAREYLLKALVISLCMAASNSCFKPLLYFFTEGTFRKSVHLALKFDHRKADKTPFNHVMSVGAA